MSRRPPVHPQPGFYETTVADYTTPEGDSVVVTHADVEQIAARPRWNIEMAKARVDGKIASAKANRAKRKPRKRS